MSSYALTSRLGLIVIFLLGVMAFQEAAAEPPVLLPLDSPTVLTMGQTTITQADIDAYLLRVPEEHRGGVLQSADRIGELLTNLVLIKAFVPLAHQEGLLDDEKMRARLNLAAAREARDIFREHFRRDIELDDYSTRGRELYLTDPERFKKSETIDFEHILVLAGQTRSEVEAMARVLELHEMISEGAEFANVAREYSDDPGVDENGGLYEAVAADSLVPQVAALMGQASKGELNPPVRSQHGWHLVRLKAVHEGEIPEWEEVKDRAMRAARENHLTTAFERVLRDIQDQPFEFEEGSIAKLLARYGVVDDDEQPTEDEILPTLFED